jgi:long-chain acyl-CoA synthetase
MLLQLVSVHESDRFLSFLPLSHSFERTVGYYLPIATGSCVSYARSIQALPEDLRNEKPTVLVSVPRIYERVHVRIQEQLASQGRIASALFAWTEQVGWRRFLREQGRGAPESLVDRLLWPLLHRAVAAKLLDQFGGQVRLAISGGAPIGESVSRCFLSLGLPLLQGYGMTETSPVVSANAPGDNDPASVGRPLAGMEIKIGADDELLVRGPTVMRGYWQRPEDTARVLDSAGWLRTGDQARLAGGRLYIKGRIKDIIVTSTGEKVAPGDLELAITADPLFAQALVLGEGRPFLSALLVIEPGVWAREAASLGIDPADGAALNSAPARELALARIRDAVRSFPVYATPRALWLSAEPWTIANGLITPTLKAKRAVLIERFADQIRALYARR